MYGLEAINANNGWAVSVVGISIVFTGLVMLALIISQIHRLLNLSKRPEKKEEENYTAMTENQKEKAKQFNLLVKRMEDNFSLPRLLYLAKISGMRDPDSDIDILLKSKIIFPDGKGLFNWNKDLFEKIILRKNKKKWILFF